MTLDNDRYRTMDICELSQGLANGEFTATDILQCSHARIEQSNPQLNAFCALNADACREAEASDKRRRQNAIASPIDGIPVAIKDNLVSRGLPCTWGSRLFQDFVPGHDEIPIERLRAAGAVFVGKTNVPEFTLEGYCGNTIHGVTGNPWNPDLTPGGSSGGSAAAVASGMVPSAFGTDGGGSIRRPAAYTGLVGLKPSIGRIARGNGLPQLLLDFEVVGLLCRSVRDCRLIYTLMAGHDPRDHRSGQLATNTTALKPCSRILYVETFGNAPLNTEIALSVRQAAAQLSSLGHDIQFGQLPLDLDPINTFWPLIGQFSLARLKADYPDMAVKSAARYVDLAEAGENLNAASIHRGLESVWSLRDRVSRLFEEFDFILTPSCAAMPWAADEIYSSKIDGKSVGPRGHAVYTGWVNACGHPAISLPSVPDSDGLPIGFQLIAGFGCESALLEIAEQFEAVYPWVHTASAPYLNSKKN